MNLLAPEGKVLLLAQWYKVISVAHEEQVLPVALKAINSPALPTTQSQ